MNSDEQIKMQADQNKLNQIRCNINLNCISAPIKETGDTNNFLQERVKPETEEKRTSLLHMDASAKPSIM